MVYKINFELKDGTLDEIIISGDTIEEIREIAQYQMEIRNGKALWSEKIE